MAAKKKSLTKNVPKKHRYAENDYVTADQTPGAVVAGAVGDAGRWAADKISSGVGFAANALTPIGTAYAGGTPQPAVSGDFRDARDLGAIPRAAPAARPDWAGQGTPYTGSIRENSALGMARDTGMRTSASQGDVSAGWREQAADASGQAVGSKWAPDVIRNGNSYSQTAGPSRFTEGGYDPAKEYAITQQRTQNAAAELAQARADKPQGGVYSMGTPGSGLEWDKAGLVNDMMSKLSRSGLSTRFRHMNDLAKAVYNADSSAAASRYNADSSARTGMYGHDVSRANNRDTNAMHFGTTGMNNQSAERRTALGEQGATSRTEMQNKNQMDLYGMRENAESKRWKDRFGPGTSYDDAQRADAEYKRAQTGTIGYEKKAKALDSLNKINESYKVGTPEHKAAVNTWRKAFPELAGGLAAGGVVGYKFGDQVQMPQVDPGLQAITQPRIDPDRAAYAQYLSAMSQVDRTGRSIIPFGDFLENRRAALGQMQASRLMQNPQAQVTGFAKGDQVGAIPVQGQELMGVGPAAGGPREDTIPAVIDGSQPAALSSGEFVVTAKATESVGAPVLRAIMKGLEAGNPGVIQGLLQVAAKASAPQKPQQAVA